MMEPIDDLDERAGRRLRGALEAEARRSPLPEDFTSMVIAGLPALVGKHRRPLFALPALATVAIAAVGLVVILNSSLRPPPSATIGPGSSATVTETPNASSSRGSGALVTFSNEVFSLEYPAAWHVIARDLTARHYEWIPLVVGTGDWDIPCETVAPTLGTLGGVHCYPDAYSVPAGGVVVTITTSQGPGIPPPYVSAPPGAIQLRDGLFATVVETSSTSVWQVYVPDWMHPLTIEAHFADPGAEELRADVRRLVESLRLVPQPSGS
jgi:hypothetical protein